MFFEIVAKQECVLRTHIFKYCFCVLRKQFENLKYCLKIVCVFICLTGIQSNAKSNDFIWNFKLNTPGTVLKFVSVSILSMLHSLILGQCCRCLKSLSFIYYSTMLHTTHLFGALVCSLNFA